MSSTAPLLDKSETVLGDMKLKTPIAYKLTRSIASGFNAIQMGLAEAYINGLEVPDDMLVSTLHATMPILFKYFPGLLAPYEWVLNESDHLAESSKELMKIQYDLPQEMMNQMMGESKLMYPKYSMGLWKNGATNLEESQMHMLDQVIERSGIMNGDRILDFGCGWGCVPNYIFGISTVKITIRQLWLG